MLPAVGIGDGERERGGDRGVDGVPPLAHHLGADRRRDRVLRDDHRPAGPYRLGAPGEGRGQPQPGREDEPGPGDPALQRDWHRPMIAASRTGGQVRRLRDLRSRWQFRWRETARGDFYGGGGSCAGAKLLAAISTVAVEVALARNCSRRFLRWRWKLRWRETARGDFYGGGGSCAGAKLLAAISTVAVEVALARNCSRRFLRWRWELRWRDTSRAIFAVALGVSLARNFSRDLRRV